MMPGEWSDIEVITAEQAQTRVGLTQLEPSTEYDFQVAYDEDFMDGAVTQQFTTAERNVRETYLTDVNIGGESLQGIDYTSFDGFFDAQTRRFQGFYDPAQARGRRIEATPQPAFEHQGIMYVQQVVRIDPRELPSLQNVHEFIVHTQLLVGGSRTTNDDRRFIIEATPVTVPDQSFHVGTYPDDTVMCTDGTFLWILDDDRITLRAWRLSTQTDEGSFDVEFPLIQSESYVGGLTADDTYIYGNVNFRGTHHQVIRLRPPPASRDETIIFQRSLPYNAFISDLAKSGAVLYLSAQDWGLVLEPLVITTRELDVNNIIVRNSTASLAVGDNSLYTHGLGNFLDEYSTRTRALQSKSLHVAPNIPLGPIAATDDHIYMYSEQRVYRFPI